MSLSSKTALPVILMGLLLSLAAYLIQTKVIFPAFTDLEVHYAKDNIDRAIRRLESQREIIDFTVYDWSAWDDTYRFVEDRNVDYIESNLHPETFLNFRFDVALFMDNSGDAVWARVYDFGPEGEIHDHTDQYLGDILPSAFAHAQTIDADEDIDDQTVSGVMVVEDTPILFSVRPVVRSDGSGDARGYVLFGQFLDEEVVEKFSEHIVLDFEIEPVEPPYEDLQPGDYSINNISGDLLSVSKIYSIEGSPSLRASANMARSITRLGSETTIYGIAFFVLLCIAFVLMLLWLFHNVVVRPIQHLKDDIASLSGTMDYSMRASVRSNDEIGALSKEFNAMLTLIESNNSQLLGLNTKLASEHEKVLTMQDELQSANAELKKLSEKDALTGLANRFALEKKLEQDWSLLSRTHLPLSVMIIDIDYFKAYNDLYGHQAGDACLKRVAELLQKAAKRTTDMVARFGGEEFLIVLPGTPASEALEIAEALRTSINQAGIEHGGSPVEPFVTLSIGLSTAVPSPGSTAEDLIRTADKALYSVKRDGRNQFRFEPMYTPA